MEESPQGVLKEIRRISTSDTAYHTSRYGVSLPKARRRARALARTRVRVSACTRLNNRGCAKGWDRVCYGDSGMGAKVRTFLVRARIMVYCRKKGFTMKKWMTCLLMALAVGFARAEVSQFDGVAAYVDDKVVTIDTVMKELHLSFNLAALPPQEAYGKVRELFPVVRDLAIERILILKAYDESGMTLPNEIINRRMQEIVARDFGGDEALLKAMLRERQMTYAEWMKLMRENTIVAAMRQFQVTQKVVVSPRKVKAYYAEHRDSFGELQGVHLRTIMLSPDQGAAVMEEVLAELAGGEDFGVLAKQYSQDAKAAEGGDWGFIQPEKEFNADVVEMISQLKVGERSEPLNVMGYLLLLEKVAERRTPPPPLSEIWSTVEARVREELGMARYEAWINELRENAYIKIVDVEL